MKKYNIAPNTNFYQEQEVFKRTDDKIDATEINLIYGSKVWTYYADGDNISHQTFDINNLLNQYKNNNKNIKINTIKNMQKLNYNNETIIKYFFPKLNVKINNIEKVIEKPCKNAYFSFNNNKINIFNEEIGINIDREKLNENILLNYENSDVINIKIPIKKTYPEIRKNDLLKSLNKRAEFSTNFSSSTPSRKHNIRMAVKNLNGIELLPNEEFSFNNVIGKRSSENGYRSAKIIVNGEFVEGIGGGVCQVSTTLYNAVLKAGLKIIASNKHSEKVSYVATGFDAMVNWGSSDLKFVNNTNQVIHIFANTKNDKINIFVYGETLDGVRYELRNEVSDVQKCKEEIKRDIEGKYLDKVKYDDEWFYLKKGRDGYIVKTYRDTFSNGNLIKTELLRTDKFTKHNAIKMYGNLQRKDSENSRETQ